MADATDIVLTQINRANEFLEKARSAQEVVSVIAMGEAARVYANRVKAGSTAVSNAERFILFANAKLGTLLQAMPKKHGSRGSRLPNEERSSILEVRLEPTIEELGIDYKTASNAQLLAANVDMLHEIADSTPDIRRGAVIKKIRESSQRKVRTDKRHAAAEENPAVNSNILIGDFRDHANKIADGSVSLIFTDPPYDRNASKMLPELGLFAASKLADGGSLVLYVGHTQLPAALDALRPHLRYWWTVACFHSGGNTMMREYGIKAGWKPVLWFVKGTRHDNSIIVEDTMSGGREKDHHDWQQSESEAAYWIEKLTTPDGFIVDPFLGGGTTAVAASRLGRSWIGIEIDDDTAAIAAARVKKDGGK